MVSYIKRDRLVETFLELVRINSPSFGESELGDLLARRLQEAGCEVRRQEYDRSFNLLAYKKGNNGARPLLLSGHMDTIEPTEGIAFVIEDGVIRTTGGTVLGADDKSALAQVLEALTAIREKDIPHGDIEIAFTSGEEKGLVGAKNLDFSGLRSNHALVLDCGGAVGNLVVAAPTHYTYKMRITGRSAHAGIEPERGVSAIKVASKIITEAPDGRIDDETTANIGMIRGGTATNVVPKEAVIRGEIRSHNAGKLEEIKRVILDTAGLIAEGNHARVHIDGQVEYRAFRIERNDPFLLFVEGVHRRWGIEPVYTVTGGGSDANVFNGQGIAAINISTGMQKVHSTEEHISIEDLCKGCEIVLRTISEFVRFKG